MLSTWLLPFLRETVINQVEYACILFETHQDILWFQVSMDVASLMHGLDSLDELVSKQEHSLEGELAAAVDKHVL